MIAAQRIETAPPPLAIDLGAEDLASGATTWTALPDLGETTVSAGNPRRELDYMHARYRSPLTSRFLSTDPVDGDPWSPQSWNKYAYVQGNPINFTDPFGLFMLNPSAIQGAALRAKCYESGQCTDETITVQDTAPAADVYTVVESGLDMLANSSFLRNSLGSDSVVTQGIRVTSSFIGNLSTPPNHGCIAVGSTNYCGDILGGMAGPPGTAAAAQLKILKPSQLKRLGLDAHKIKQALFGSKSKNVSKFNIAVDGEGRVVLTPVQKGTASNIDTGLSVDDLKDLSR